MKIDDARDWAKYVLELVRRSDEDAELCLDGRESDEGEWLVETTGPERVLLTVRVVQVEGQ